jgi:hypothetical protein
MSSGQCGFWDAQDRLRELSAQGDPLEKVAMTFPPLISARLK